MRVATRSSSSRSWLTNSTVLGDSTSRVLEPALGRHVEVVVRLVEHEHLVGPAQQRLEHDAASAPRRTASTPGATGPARRACPARRRCRRPRASPTRSRRRRPSRPAPGRSRAGPARSRAPSSPARCGRPRGPPGAPGRARPRRAGRAPCVSSRTLPMNWRMTPEAAAARHGAVGCREVAGQDPQQGRLAGAVGADQRDLGALPHPEGDVAQQASPVGQGEAHGVDVEVAHEAPVSPTSAANSPEIRGRAAAASVQRGSSAARRRAPNIPATRVDASALPRRQPPAPPDRPARHAEQHRAADQRPEHRGAHLGTEHGQDGEGDAAAAAEAVTISHPWVSW